MATCDTCGVEVLMPGRCVSCCVTALDSYESIKEKNAELVLENTKLRDHISQEMIPHADAHEQLGIALEVLSFIREAVPEGSDNPEEWPYGNGHECVMKIQEILYSKVKT